MKTQKRVSSLLIATFTLIAASSLTACGKPQMLDESSTSGSASRSTASTSTSSGGGSNNDPVQLDDGSTDSNLADPYTFDVRGLGNSTPVKITLTTTVALKKIRLRYTPKPQDDFALVRDSSGKWVKSGFSPNYSIFGLSISVAGKENRTPPLRSGLYGSQQSSPIYEYTPKATLCSDPSSASTRIPDNLSTMNVTTANANALKITQRYCYVITFSNPVYDYHCLTQGRFCPYSNIEPTHPWVGSVEIQTDETRALQ